MGNRLMILHKDAKAFSELIELSAKDMGINPLYIEKDILDTNFHEVALPAVTSKGSQFRKTVHSYPKLNGGDFGHANENIILEINSFAKPIIVLSIAMAIDFKIFLL
jgi:hypothetical protein